MPAKWGLEELSVRGRSRAPFGRSQISAEPVGTFEAFGEKGRPIILVKHLRLQFGCERKLYYFPLGVVFAGHEMKRLHQLGLFSPLNDPRLSAAKNEITGLWNTNAGKIECIIVVKFSNVRQMGYPVCYPERQFAVSGRS